MGFITYGQLLGVFSTDFQARLDIGTKAMRKKQSADHLSWATRLRIKRLDGPSVGDVEDTHMVGIYSEDWKYRLDIGTGSMKTIVPVTHMSWATKLKIWPYSSKGSKAGQRIGYNDTIGVFSEDGLYRLDIGSSGLKPQKADHVSWATKLIIQDADPIVEVGKILNMNYSLKDAKVSGTKTEGVFNKTLTNSSNLSQTFDLGETFKTTETKNFSNTVGFKIGTKVSGEAGVPLVSKGKVEVSAEFEFSHEWGKTVTEEKSITWKASPVVEPNTILKVLVMTSKSSIEVPYEMEADVKTLTGEWYRRKLPGIFYGDVSHDFKYTLEDFDLAGNPINGPRDAGMEMTTSVQ